MCLIAYHMPGAPPDPAALRAGAAVNRDGSGFAIWAPARFITRHGDFEDVLAAFIMAREDYPEGPAIFHSRAATAGDKSPANLQPFPVRLADGQGYMAHNGTLPIQPVIAAEKGWSDSRLFAHRVLESSLFPIPDVDEYLRKHGSRVAIMTLGGEQHLLGDWDPRNVRDGVHYSNADFVVPPAPDGQPPHDHLHRAYRSLAERYRDGDEEAGQHMAALKEVIS